MVVRDGGDVRPDFVPRAIECVGPRPARGRGCRAKRRGRRRGAEAVAAGIELLKRDGNAADAAAATILALSVTDSAGFCFGGEVPILVFNARRKVVEVLAGQGAAPHLATCEYFTSHGGIPTKGVTAAAVPAAFDAVVTLLDRYGTLKLADVAEPALRLLDREKAPWHPLLARSLRRLIAAEAAGGPDRGQGLRLAADYFYRGPLAHELADWCEQHGGLIRFEDLATHVTRVEQPAAVDYRGHVVYKCGPWTQGPALLATLRLLEGFDLAALGHNRPETIHLTVEAMKLALADRDVYYADPLFVDVPLATLLSRPYADMRRPLIDPRHASLEQHPATRAMACPCWPSATSDRGCPARYTTPRLAPRPIVGGMSWSRRPAVGAVCKPARPASGLARDCRASTPGRGIPTASRRASGRA